MESSTSAWEIGINNYQPLMDEVIRKLRSSNSSGGGLPREGNLMILSKATLKGVSLALKMVTSASKRAVSNLMMMTLGIE